MTTIPVIKTIEHMVTGFLATVQNTRHLPTMEIF